MSIEEMRGKLHNYLEIVDDQKLEALFMSVEEDVESTTCDFTDDFKKELDRRYEAIMSGKERLFTAEETQERMNKIIQSAIK